MRLTIVLAVLLALGVGAYCLARRDRAVPPEEPPKLWEDASFLAQLAKSGPNGLDGVTIVAPASGLGEEGAKTMREAAAAMGVRFPDAALKRGAVPYNANSDEVRLELLRQALADPGVDVLWALRGGYGASRLLARLSAMPEPERRKTFVGYSDMTFLHLFLARWGWRTVHGPMFAELGQAGKKKEEENFRLLAEVLSGERKELVYSGIRPVNEAAGNSSRLEGVLLGGNLTCLAAAAGTPWFPDADGMILALEDVKESGYKIDRMLTQLGDAGLLDRVVAVVLGEFSEGDENTGYALERFAAAAAVPVFRTDLFGHGAKNRPLIFNAPAVLEKERDSDGEGAAFRLVMPGLDAAPSL